MALTAIALSLLVITAGIFLLAKERKEELGIKYKIAGYAITLSGFTLAIVSICFGFIMLFHHGQGYYKNKGGYHHGDYSKNEYKKGYYSKSDKKLKRDKTINKMYKNDEGKKNIEEEIIEE